MRRGRDVANACEVLAVCEWMDLFARIYIVCLHIYSGACTQAGVGIPKSRVPSWYGPGTGDQPTRPEYSRVPSWYGPVTTNQWHACVLSSLRRGPRLSTDSHQPRREAKYTVVGAPAASRVCRLGARQKARHGSKSCLSSTCYI